MKRLIIYLILTSSCLSAQYYGQWTRVDSMNLPRDSHSAVLLEDGIAY